MRIAITGANGFIAKNLINRLGEHDYLLIGKGQFNKDTLIDFSPHQVYHLGAEIYDINQMYESNVALTYDLMMACVQTNVKAVVICGSSSEYGASTVPMKESKALFPRNMYEATKGAASLLAQGVANQYNLPVVIARPFSLYGLHEKPHRLMPTLLKAFQTGQKCTISEGVHDWIHIDDFIDGLMMILPNANSTAPIYNIGTGVQHSNLDVFYAFCEAFGYEVEYEYIPAKTKPYDAFNWVADISRIAALGFEPKYNLKSGIKKYVDESA